MKKTYIAIIAAAILLPSLYAAVSPAFYPQTINWHSYEEARAMNSEKPLFFFGSMRFCTACAAMEKDEFTNPDLAKLLNEKFIPVKETINFALSNFAFEDLIDENGEPLTFRGFPAVMIVQGNEYSLSHGYKNVEQLTNALNKALVIN